METTEAFDRYQRLMTELREGRRKARNVEKERTLCDELADLWDLLNDEEQAIVQEEGWKGWPDLYDKAVFIETAPDPEDPSTYGRLPRKMVRGMMEPGA